jgi:hypothetical protein
MICEADNWVVIKEFGQAKEQWLTKFLGLENGIPSHDTFGGVYVAIDTDQLSAFFSCWIADLVNISSLLSMASA